MNLTGLSTIRPTRADARATVAELGLTTAFMTTVFSLVRWGLGPMGSGASVTELRVRVFVVSTLVGLVIVGFATSLPGRISGAHMNPAITLGLFAFGSVPARRVLPYLAAQSTGSIAAAALTRILWGPAVSGWPVRWAVVQPRSGWTAPSVATAEAATLMVIVAVMCWVTTRRPAWPLAWIVGGLFGLQGAILGTLTGGSANPARQLGPALLSGEVHLLAVYLIAPLAGGILAGRAATRYRYGRPMVLSMTGTSAGTADVRPDAGVMDSDDGPAMGLGEASAMERLARSIHLRHPDVPLTAITERTEEPRKPGLPGRRMGRRKAKIGTSAHLRHLRREPAGDTRVADRSVQRLTFRR